MLNVRDIAQISRNEEQLDLLRRYAASCNVAIEDVVFEYPPEDAPLAERHHPLLRLASVAAETSVAPKPDGGYLLEEEEMIWQLSMFGVERQDRRTVPGSDAQLPMGA